MFSPLIGTHKTVEWVSEGVSSEWTTSLRFSSLSAPGQPVTTMWSWASELDVCLNSFSPFGPSFLYLHFGWSIEENEHKQQGAAEHFWLFFLAQITLQILKISSIPIFKQLKKKSI